MPSSFQDDIDTLIRKQVLAHGEFALVSDLKEQQIKRCYTEISDLRKERDAARETIQDIIKILRDPPTPSRMLIPIILAAIYPEEYRGSQ